MNIDTLLNESPPPCPSICGRTNDSNICGPCPYGTKTFLGNKNSLCIPCIEKLSWFETCFLIFYFAVPFIINGKRIVLNYFYVDGLGRWKDYENVEIYEDEKSFKLYDSDTSKDEDISKNEDTRIENDIEEGDIIDEIEELDVIERQSLSESDYDYEKRTTKENIMAYLPFIEHLVILIIETLIPTFVSIYLIPPSFSFIVHSCRTDDLRDWYPFFYSVPEFSKDTNFLTRKSKSCSYEIVFPLFSLPILYSIISLFVYIITRTTIYLLSRFRYTLSSNPIHVGLWVYPIQLFLHLFFGGIIYTYFPFICIIYSFRQYSHDLDELSTPFLTSLYNELKTNLLFLFKIIICTLIYYLAFFSLFSKYHESKLDFFTAAVFSIIPTILFPQLKRFFKPFLKDKDTNFQQQNGEDFFNSEEMLQLREALRERRNDL
ncbi:JNK1/MAPK8-associated membrane protein [Strongyloides ratti]|uniref:JNK1/MAPK8-associated membrane protein n=1 Tax=Strongyloides ratti TaxID=34506 RepID=A0A090MW68_STRRB|nr:JNK1/MAPK8-associated membrane protein [Strongyloides ratti]CEF63488.1 JNK1/MAPK8-associated membrane protein [Strongyloides ratti]